MSFSLDNWFSNPDNMNSTTIPNTGSALPNLALSQIGNKGYSQYDPNNTFSTQDNNIDNSLRGITEYTGNAPTESMWDSFSKWWEGTKVLPWEEVKNGVTTKGSGWLLPTVNVLSGLGNYDLAKQTLNTQKDALAFNKDMANKNYAAQLAAYNANLENRANAAYLGMDRNKADKARQEYLNRNKVG